MKKVVRYIYGMVRTCPKSTVRTCPDRTLETTHVPTVLSKPKNDLTVLSLRLQKPRIRDPEKPLVSVSYFADSGVYPGGWLVYHEEGCSVYLQYGQDMT